MENIEFMTNHPKAGELWKREHFRSVIEFGFAQKMSDIKLIPDNPPFIKRRGDWVPVCAIPMTDTDIQNVVSWTSANESLSARILSAEPADYGYDISLERGKKKRFRCNATGCLSPHGSGITLVMRQIPDRIPSLTDVSMPDEILRNLFPDQGIVMVSGPPGSGKSTLLAAGLGYARIAYPNRSIETYEDPIEFDYSAIQAPEGQMLGPLAQMEIFRHLRTFTDTGRNAARRSQDVVLIGESRDLASFRALIEVANMGLLTFTTIHTRSVAETPERILAVFEAAERQAVKATLINSLRFVVQQRLLKTPEGQRVPVREWLRFTEPIRTAMSSVSIPDLAPMIKEEVKKHGKLLIDDVREKYKQGKICKTDRDKMEIEYEKGV